MATEPIRVCVLGAGAMGSLFGGLLATTGHTVTLVDVDDAHLAAIRANGLVVDTDEGSKRVRLEAVRPDAATGTPDLVLVFTKSMHTRSALDGIRRLIGQQTRLLSLQNGLGNREALLEFAPADRVFVGVTTIPADRVAPGHVRSHGDGSVRLDNAGGDSPFAARIAAMLDEAGLPAVVDPDVTAAIWEKVAFNAAMNSVCAVSRCTVGELAALPDARALALAIAAETTAVARAHGIEANPEAVAATVNAALDRHGSHRPSMLQDLLAGRPTEIEAINGEVVRAAIRAGIAVPHTSTLLTLVRLTESKTTMTGGSA